MMAAFAALSLLSASAADGYKISGVAEGVEKGDTVYLCEMQGFFSLVPLDTAYVDDAGRFEFKGDFDGLAYRTILPMHGGKPAACVDLLLENADFTVQAFADPNKKAVVKGGPANRMYEEYQKGEKVYDDQINQPWSIVMDSTSTREAKDKARAEVDSLTRIKDAYTKRFLMDHIPSAVSDMLFALNSNKMTEEEKKAAMDKMDKGHHYYYYKKLLAERAAEAATAVGKRYTDLAMPDPQGKTVKVSDYVGKNKYTLIDFWASWCGPCRAEMPTVVKAYADYHKKGFEVVGVSFDNNKEAWVKAIRQLNLPWPHMSDLKGWECAAASAYNVKGIPANVLVDTKGNIVAKNLRGQDLLDKLAELLK